VTRTVINVIFENNNNLKTIRLKTKFELEIFYLLFKVDSRDINTVRSKIKKRHLPTTCLDYFVFHA
jgi:hypothetical protein